MSVSPNYLDDLRYKMEARFGVQNLVHPHPGVIGPPLNMHQAMYAMLPTQQSFDHLKIPYDSHHPQILSCEPIEETVEVTNMDVD